MEYRVPKGASFARVQLGVLHALETRSEGVLRAIEGKVVAPISLIAPNRGLYDLYVDESGILYFADEIAGSAPVADGFQAFLEREALQGLPRPEGPGATWIYTPERVGALWADAAGAEMLFEASDSFQSVYWGPGARILERAPHPYDPEGTSMGSERLDGLVQALQILHDNHPAAPVRVSPPLPGAKEQGIGRAPTLRLPRLAEHGTDVVGELWVSGSAGHWKLGKYGVHGT